MPTVTPMKRLFAGLLAAAMLLTVAVAPVAAHGNDKHDKGHRSPTRIDLPNGFQPEGIESRGNWLYTGSLVDGAIWRGSAKTGKGKILVQGQAGLSAAGLHIDGRGRLWVAGATSQSIRVYSSYSGALLATYAFPTAGFINDLDIVGNKVYATDSATQQLLVIPLRKHGKLPNPSVATTKPLTGDIVYGDGFDANGIAKSWRWLITVQSNTGLLFRVNPKTGVATTIDTGGYSLTAGDGIEIVGRTMYVVRNQENLVAVMRLSKDRLSAKLIRELTSDGLDVPTTVTKSSRGLFVVNARFGTDPTADTQYWITRLSKR
jgi:sugar lactone lactonase YvrE